MALTNFTKTLAIMAVGLVPAVLVPVHAQENDSDLVYDVQALMEEVRELRGLVESQQREIENLRRRQRDQYLDLDRRLQSLEQGGSESNGSRESESSGARSSESDQTVRPVSEPVESRPNREEPEVREPIDAQAEITPLAEPSTGPARELESASEEEKEAYDRAFRALRETRYADAAEGFTEFLDEYSDSSYAPNALYWLAETYYVTRDFQTALDYFNELLERFPDSSKQGDALLKIGFSHYELESWNQARAALEQVRSQHPGTTLARLAEGRLRDMRLAGHY
ncbi:tol-pal system protein YbgF [Wenzhouxiangella sp. EGI_FJ10305]|uniref:tol-pal system protein YbgF n=1 Tax=Wenzhouxiangella sp. EGI_FJ10305 TaxID=3243768 RepID=UPI0035D6EECC